jgi:hypothetical protein
MVVSAACLEALENSFAFAIKAGLIGPESDASPLSGGNHITRIMEYASWFFWGRALPDRSRWLSLLLL